MKTATVREIKTELSFKNEKELIEIILRLSKFKKENKELLTYLLYEASNETAYIQAVEALIMGGFSDINTTSYYYIKKSIRKILRETKKYIRYSGQKSTEVELLIIFLEQMIEMEPSFRKSMQMKRLYETQLNIIHKSLDKLHEDIQFDFEERVSFLENQL